MNWLAFFIAVTALAFVVQASVMVAMFVLVRRTAERAERIASDVQASITPVIMRVQLLLEDTQPRITSVVADAADISRLARSQAYKIDRVFSETLDRLRLQLAHADQILTGALEAVEDAGKTVRQSVLGPVQSATAVIRGIQTGLEFFRSRRRRHAESSHSSDLPDENLFI
jgi:hypothetical protein